MSKVNRMHAWRSNSEVSQSIMIINTGSARARCTGLCAAAAVGEARLQTVDPWMQLHPSAVRLLASFTPEWADFAKAYGRWQKFAHFCTASVPNCFPIGFQLLDLWSFWTASNSKCQHTVCQKVASSLSFSQRCR